MQVLVTGGTGFVGKHLCAELHERGHDVTAMSRSPWGADLPSGVDRVEGDVTEYDEIEGAFEGQDAVANLVALSPLYKPSGGRTHDEVHLGGTKNCVTAAREHGVDRLLQLSGLDAHPDALTAYLRAKGKAERVLRESDLETTIVRPSVLFGDGCEIVPFTKRLKRMFAPGVPFYPLPGGGKTPFQLLSIEDLAPILAEALEGAEHAGETYEFGGPEVFTLADVARLVFRADGERIRIVPLPMPLAKLGLTAMGPIPFIPFGPDQARSLQLDSTVEENDVTAFGREEGDLETFREYLGVV